MMKRLISLVHWLAAHCVCLLFAAAATPEQIRERVGIYIWGNVPDLAAAMDDARGIGADRAVRAFIGPWSDTPPYRDDTRPLAEKQNDAAYQRMFNQYEVIMLTAYDSFSYEKEYGEADTLPELQARSRSGFAVRRPNRGKIEQPSLGVVKHLAQMSRKQSFAYLEQVRQEFSDFAFALARYDKTFILSNWEAENDVPDTAYWPWFLQYLQARVDGIAEGRARAARAKLPGSIHTAFEFNIIPGFAGRRSGLEMLGKNLRGVEYLSYSAWWSMGAQYDSRTMGESFREAIRRIRASSQDGQQIIIGEFGEYWNDYPNAERLRAIVDTAIAEQVRYLFNWTLYDQPGEKGDRGSDASRFGKYTQQRKLTPQGRAMRRWFPKAGD